MTGYDGILNGASRLYAVFGDPVAQVLTPTLANPLFAAHGLNIHAVPFHVTPENFENTWRSFQSMPNIAGIGVTVPHKLAAARLCDSVTSAAKEVGAVNSIQRKPDGSMHGALFDGLGFVLGLRQNRSRLREASVLLAGAGGAGRAIAHALAAEDVSKLSILDINPEAVRMTADMVNRIAGKQIAEAAETDISDHTILINATPIGLKSTDRFPVVLERLGPHMLVADIAAMSGDTELLQKARAAGCGLSDGQDMLKAQIALIAGFAAGQEAGTPLGG